MQKSQAHNRCCMLGHHRVRTSSRCQWPFNVVNSLSALAKVSFRSLLVCVPCEAEGNLSMRQFFD
uniref:Uncharacterized protein n=1 Tax=Lepeophtheirus salmonis TaxID=72036 RepID=A0A0K2TT58_LEPSM